MNKFTILVLSSTSLLYLSSCNKTIKPKTPAPPPITCPKITKQNKRVTCPNVLAFKDQGGSWMLSDSRWPNSNWKIKNNFLMGEPASFNQAVFTGTSEGRVTCFYIGKDPGSGNATGRSSMWVQLSYNGSVLKPCGAKWDKKTSQCRATNTEINNVSQCPFNMKN